MGNPMTRRLVRPHGRAGAMTPLLRFLAGVHAEALAIAWPAPHAGFLALPSARRHAAAILLARDLELNEIARIKPPPTHRSASSQFRLLKRYTVACLSKLYT